MSDRLTTALEAAIAETERIALATESLEWIARLEHGDADVAEKDSGYLVAAYREVYPECAISLDDDVAVHIAHNDPKRVLRRVARDRKLLARLKLILTAQLDQKGPDGRLVTHPIARFHARAMLADLAEDYGIEVED